ncbi:Asp-tRNA(Asn)/Glu-tRNA(Gln) amidotransferase GatCAB subunit A [Candidatus Kuenenbacteria bacterium HGW-Kuenenbacteria-1]|uniref:Glutamyl-tRNA(Gln) amidotransferase subunit A n=1 Tax=Candidatus Kuenenbacteria bacterium HGW-Kuenenbacteria-1 TaxID=2013812 RepID=A0A2N1UNA2_9BACT|nr:MAG: Asp-tRNA(Asn)/Glu-tRNA(Gln) amidotransferase GatCAB subunit A [Candidatus Kuenenbacteria bacterium HGW-Kuenenbacteria-1]
MFLNELTIKQCHDGLMKKDFSSVELTRACLHQIKKQDDKIHSFVLITEKEALEQAKKVDDKIAQNETIKILEGIPAGIKDLLCTKGIRTTACSKILENFIPPYDCTVIKKLKENGFVILGKQNCDEFAMGSSTENSAFGSTKNPYDLERTAGGSSGGSAASVVANECIYSIGTDTGGSIRQPAAFCGMVGLKPTYGRVSRFGITAYASSLEQAGPIIKTVEDAAIVLEAIAGNDKLDSTTSFKNVPNYSANLNKDIKGIKIGLPREFFEQGLDLKIKESIYKALKVFENLGAKIEEINLPMTKYAIASYYIIAKAEASANLARYDGIRYGNSNVKSQNLSDVYFETKTNGFGDEVKRSIMMGTYALSSGYYDAYYLKATKIRTLIKQEYIKAFEKYDAIICPVSPILPFKIGEKIENPLAMYLIDAFTVPINLAGVPSLTVPCGKIKIKEKAKEYIVSDGESLPTAFQIIGKHFDEETILRIGNAYEKTQNKIK